MNGTEKVRESIIKRISEAAFGIKKRISGFAARFENAVTDSRIVRFLMREDTIAKVYAAGKCLALIAAGFLFGICAVDRMAYPLGFAFLIASGRLSFFVYMGSALASLTYPGLGLAFFGINTLIYIIRKILLSDSFCESRRARLILAFAASLFISLSLILSVKSGGFPYGTGEFDIIFCCFCYIFGIPLGTLLFYPVTSNESFTGSGARISLCFFCMCLIMGTSFLPFHNFKYFVSCICTLFFCTFFDGGLGIPAGALFGLATVDFVFCAPMCISAFLFQRLCNQRRIVVYPLFYISALILSLLTSVQGSVINIAISLAAGTFGFMPFGIFIASKKAHTESCTALARETVTEAYTNRMSALSGAFGAVSKLCFSFSNRMRFPTEDEVQVLVSVHCAKECGVCGENYGCRKKQLWCDRKIAAELISGKLTAMKLPERLISGCRKASAIVEDLNSEYTKLLSDRFKNNKTEILAHEYAAMGRILKYTSRISSEDVYYDGKLSALACGATKKLGLINSGTAVYGTRKKTLDISGVPVSCISIPSEELASFYSGECGELFDTPEFILDENGTFTVRSRSKELICTEYVNASHTKNGETVCGDSVSFFKSDDSYFYALIADGMGSGRDAAMTSRLTSVFVEKLLSGGAGKGVTIELLNNMLMSKNNECFSSVDLLEIDLIKKKASFVKAGAAPAYLLRSTKLFKVSSDTPPCGIIEGFCAENTSFDIFPGDIIIMLSDGITSSIDCGTALCDIMNNAKGQPLETVAGRVLDMAISLSVHDDDMSCVIVRIK